MTQPCYILLVDDDADGLFLIGRILGQAFPASEIVLARDGAEALAGLSRLPIDAIVTDNCMSEMSGLQMTREIRATGSRIPIVMVTGSDELEAEAAQSGVTLFHRHSEWRSIADAVRRCWEESK